MPRVLVVEDEPAIADTLVYALETELFETTHVLTGEAALASLHKEPYDIVILDIGLPDISGLDVCRKLRESSEVPVLFLTARNSEIDRVLGLELGGDDYVSKPFSPAKSWQGPEPFSGDPVRIVNPPTPANGSPSGDTPLYHDTHSMRVHCHGQALELTAHEYKLLLVLLAQPGRVYTRDQLLDHAWDDPGAVTDRTVDAHVKSIRAKLRSAREGAEDYVQTRRGLGYLLSF